MFLNQQDRDVFFKLYFDLLFCYNKKYKITKNFGNSRYPKSVDSQQAYEIREKLFDNPGWIDEYINNNDNELTDEERDILVSWRDYSIKDTFFIIKILAKYTVFLSTGKKHGSRLYGVTGINHPIADLYNKNMLPIVVDALLLPFKDCIIYDGVMAANRIRIGPGMRAGLNAEYKEIKDKYGIYESQPVDISVIKPPKPVKPKTQKVHPAHSSRELYNLIAPIISDICNEHLNAEYADISLKMLMKLSRKRPSPLSKGKANTWACGIVYAVGSNNFLFDKSQKPHMRATELAATFGLSQSTAGNKASEINKVLRISMFDPEWTLPSKIGNNPKIWMIEDNRGFIFDVRNAPRDIQVKVFEAGLIPYIPADQKREKSTDDVVEVNATEEPEEVNRSKGKKPIANVKGQTSIDSFFGSNDDENDLN